MEVNLRRFGESGGGGMVGDFKRDSKSFLKSFGSWEWVRKGKSRVEKGIQVLGAFARPLSP